MTTTETDATIIAASTTDAERFGEIFDRHVEGVHGYLSRRLGRARADDLTGEVFRIAFEGRARYRPQHPTARPWLFGIATNLVLKDHRRERRRLRALARLRVRSDVESTSIRVDEKVDAAASLPRVAAALLELEARDRDVVLLVAWEDLSYEEVAAALSIPVGTVRSRLSRARRQLREQLDLTSPGEPPPGARTIGAPSTDRCAEVL
jgi:RNA polymerase sigma-70 factor (ECF subfamily)